MSALPNEPIEASATAPGAAVPVGEEALPKVGDLVAGKYRIERALARGGMGAVFVGEHVGLARRVAVKFLLADVAGASARFVREARAAARLEGEHVVRVLDVGVHAGSGGEIPYLVMDLLKGCDLHAHLVERGPLPVGEAVDYVLQTCEALAEAHAQGIVHRDLKPSNLFLTRRPDGSTCLKLLDFGIAKAPAAQTWSEGHVTVVLETLGSPPYMSPEHLKDAGSVDARTDIWSLGVILHELVTRRHPFEASSPSSLIARIVLDPPAKLRTHFADAPAALEKVILRCLDKDPTARFQSVSDLARALVPLVGEGSRTAALAAIERSAVAISEKTIAIGPASAPSSQPSPTPVITDRAASGARLRIPAAPTVVQERAPEPPPVSSVSTSSSTNRFRRQHEELQALGFQIAEKLARATLANEAGIVRRLVAQFAGKLAVHASMENEALYPRLLQHSDPNVRERARSLFDDVGTIYATFGQYAKKWPTTASIEADPRAFARETREVLRVLAFRMMRENDELYPLVESVENEAPRSATRPR
jgi:serine/threonine protein kinase